MRFEGIEAILIGSLQGQFVVRGLDRIWRKIEGNLISVGLFFDVALRMASEMDSS